MLVLGFHLILLYLYRPPKLLLHHDSWCWAIRPEEMDIGGCLFGSWVSHMVRFGNNIAPVLSGH